MNAAVRGRLELVGAAVCWSLAGACVKLARPLDAWQIAGMRSLIAFFFLFAVLKPWHARPILPGIKVWLLAGAYAATVLLFIIANTLTTAANAIFIQDTAPVWVMLFAPLMLKEPFRVRDLFLLFVCAGGMTLFFFDDLSPGQRDGNLYALVSGVGFAFVILGMRWGRPKTPAELPAGPEGDLSREAIPVRGGIAQLNTPPSTHPRRPNESEQLAIYGNLVCFLLCVPMLRMPAQPHPEAFLGGLAVPLCVLVVMGIVQLGLGYYLLARGIKHVPAVEASLLVLIEPVLNPVWTFLVSGERPSAWALAGGSVIIGTVAFQALRGSK